MRHRLSPVRRPGADRQAGSRFLPRRPWSARSPRSSASPPRSLPPVISRTSCPCRAGQDLVLRSRQTRQAGWTPRDVADDGSGRRACPRCPGATPAGRSKARSVGRCGAMNTPPGSSSPVSSKITTPLQSRLQPCSGWLTMVCAASRSGAEGAGQGGMCGHRPVPLAVHRVSFRLVLVCRSSCCDKTFSVNHGGGPAEMANPDKAHHQARSHPLLHGEPAGLSRGLPGAEEEGGVSRAGRSGRFPRAVRGAVRF
jgi:hypothetical protein